AIDFEALLSHTLVIGCFTVLVAGYFRGALLRAAPAANADEHGLSLSIVPVATALGLVDLLFLMFVVIQLRYLFGGADLVATATGLTYAEYARRGFFELVTVTALVLPVLAGADWLVRNESPEHQRTFRQLANPDALIVRTNLARPPAERPFDGWYAASLSADAVPLLLDALPRLDERQQCTVGAGLREQLGRLERDGWRSWNFARARARR